MKNLARKMEKMSAYFFVLPAVILMGVFIVYPMVSSVYLSLTNWTGLGEKEFIGFGNYSQLIDDPIFWESIKLQLIWAALSVVFLALCGIILALIVEFFTSLKFLKSVTRTILFMPMMMSMVAIGLLWTMIYNPLIGVLNEFMRTIGLLATSGSFDPLGSNSLALYAAFVPAMWQWSGFGMVVFSAAMQNISQDVMEAAMVDGCTKLQQLRYIVIPLLRPTVAIVCTLNLIGGLKCFDLLYVMTGGGPGTSTQVTAIYIFKQAFVNNFFGLACAMSTIMFFVTAIFGFVFFRFSNKLAES